MVRKLLEQKFVMYKCQKHDTVLVIRINYSSQRLCSTAMSLMSLIVKEQIFSYIYKEHGAD